MTAFDGNKSEDIPARLGERVVIHVEGAGTTGYEWHLEPDEGATVVDHRIEPDGESFGAAGTESFIVELTAPHDTDLLLTLKAPWEEEPAEVHTVHLSYSGGEDD